MAPKLPVQAQAQQQPAGGRAELPGGQAVARQLLVDAPAAHRLDANAGAGAGGDHDQEDEASASSGS